MPDGLGPQRGIGLGGGNGGSGGSREVVFLAGSPFTTLTALETAASTRAAELFNSTTKVTYAHVSGEVSPNLDRNGTYWWVGSTGVYQYGNWQKVQDLDAADIKALLLSNANTDIVTDAEKTNVTTLASAPTNSVLLKTSTGVGASAITESTDMITSTKGHEVPGGNGFGVVVGNKQLQNGGTTLTINDLSRDELRYFISSTFSQANGSGRPEFDLFSATAFVASSSNKSEQLTVDSGQNYIQRTFRNPVAGLVVQYKINNPTPSTTFTGCNFVIWAGSSATGTPIFDYMKENGGQGFTLAPGDATVASPSNIEFRANEDITFRISASNGDIILAGQTIVFPPAGVPGSASVQLPFLDRWVSFSNIEQLAYYSEYLELLQAGATGVRFNGRNGQTYNMAAGAIVTSAGTDNYMTGGIDYVDLLVAKGSNDHLLPIGILTESLDSNTQKLHSVLHKGNATIVLPGQDDLPLDTPIYVTRTGSGNNEQWSFTHSNTGTDTHYVGRLRNDAGTNTYYAWIDFSLVWNHEFMNSLSDNTVIVESNGTVIKSDAKKVNFVGDHHKVTVGSSDNEQVNIEIDPGSFMVQNGTGSTTEIGQGAELGGDSSGNEVALDVNGSSQEYPTMWANGEIANGSVGEFVRAGKISGTPRIEESASRRAVTPIAAGTVLHYRVDGETFSTVVDSRFFEVGNVLSSRYRLDQTNYFDSALNLGQVSISTGVLANASRNKTIALTSGAPSTTTFTVPNLSLSQEHTNPYLVGDQITFVNTQSGKTFRIVQQINGSMQDINGNSITQYDIISRNAVTFERIAGNIWKIVGINKDAVVSDITVEYSRLINNQQAQHTNRLFTLETDNTNAGGTDDKLSTLLKSSMSGLDTYTTSSSRVVIQSGECGSDDGSERMVVSSDINLDMSTANLDAGSEAANTWYYIWLFKATSSQTVIARYSTSNNNPTVPGGYTAKRMIGAVRNDNSSNFRQFRCQGAGTSKIYTYNTEFLSLGNQKISNRNAVNIAHAVPSLHRTGYPYAQVSFEFDSGNLLCYHADNNNAFVLVPSGSEFCLLPQVQLNSSGQFHINNSRGKVTGLYMKVLGFNMELHT